MQQNCKQKYSKRLFFNSDSLKPSADGAENAASSLHRLCLAVKEERPILMNTIKRYIWSFLAFTLTLILCLIPIPDVPQLGDVPLMDKWVHFVLYGGIASAVWLDIWRNASTRQVRLSHFFWAVLVPILFGALTELAQRYLTTYRSGEWLDFLADTVGVLLALPLGLFILRPLVKRCPQRPPIP